MNITKETSGVFTPCDGLCPRCGGAGCSACDARCVLPSNTRSIGELKPCPFCGDQENLRVCYDGQLDKHVVECSSAYRKAKCIAMGPWAATRDEAIAAWNRRAPETEGPLRLSHMAVHSITRAYESGYGRGHTGRDLAQPYDPESPEGIAYHDGWTQARKWYSDNGAPLSAQETRGES